MTVEEGQAVLEGILSRLTAKHASNVEGAVGNGEARDTTDVHVSSSAVADDVEHAFR